MSSDVFQIHCPFCNAKLNAKLKHIGKEKQCPQCGKKIFVTKTVEVPPFMPENAEPPNESITLRPATLKFRDRYIILGRDRVIAAWRGGDGWKVNVGSGYSAARTAQEAIPDQGIYAFVQLICIDGIPSTLDVYRIAQRGALMAIVRDESAILNKLEDPMELEPAQKDALLRYLRSIYMTDVLDQAKDVLAALSII